MAKTANVNPDVQDIDEETGEPIVSRKTVNAIVSPEFKSEVTRVAKEEIVKRRSIL